MSRNILYDSNICWQDQRKIDSIIKKDIFNELVEIQQKRDEIMEKYNNIPIAQIPKKVINSLPSISLDELISAYSTSTCSIDEKLCKYPIDCILSKYFPIMAF